MRACVVQLGHVGAGYGPDCISPSGPAIRVLGSYGSPDEALQAVNQMDSPGMVALPVHEGVGLPFYLPYALTAACLGNSDAACQSVQQVGRSLQGVRKLKVRRGDRLAPWVDGQTHAAVGAHVAGFGDASVEILKVFGNESDAVACARPVRGRVITLGEWWQLF